MNAIINGREFNVTNTEAIEGRLGADLIARGFEAAFYTLTGKRKSCMVCFRSIKTGEFVKAY